MIDLTVPTAILLAAVLFAVPVLLLRRRRGRSGLAAAAVLLLLLAALGVRVEGTGPPADVLVLDLSWSTGRSVPLALRELVESAGIDTPAEVIVFGERSLVLDGPDEDGAAVGEEQAAAVGRDGSDLAGALRTAAELAAPGRVVTVLTDGRVETDGLAGPVAAIRARGATPVLRRWGRKVPLDARIASLRVPARIPEGKAARARIGLEGPAGEGVGVRFLVDGVELSSTRVNLPAAGRLSLSLSFGPFPPGFHEVSVALEGSADDPCAKNDRLASGLIVTGRKRALLVNAGALDIPGFEVETGSLDRRLDDYDLIVLADLPITQLPEAGETVRRYVEDGGGLLVLGGPSSFGPGGWGGQPIATCLPVRCHPEDQGLFVAVLLDRSGTMAEPFSEGGPAKFETARKATSALIRRLPLGARVLLAPFTREVLGEPEVKTLARREDRDGLVEDLARAGAPGGGTSLSTPLRLVLEKGSAVKAEKRLVLLFTDGRVEGESEQAVREAAAALRRAGYRLEIFAVGEDANRDLLDSLGGQGRPATAVRQAGTLSKAFLAALLRLQGEGRVRTGSFTARRTKAPGLAFGGSLLLRGYVRTWPREGAAVWHALADDAPVTAGGRYGLGRSVVVTTDPLGDWAGSWPGTGILGALAAAAARPSALGSARFHLEKGELTAWVRARRPSLPCRVVAGRARCDVTLEAAGDGEFRGALPPLPAGPAEIVLETPGGLMRGGLSIPYPDEFRGSGPDEIGLDRLQGIFGPEPPERPATGGDAGPCLAGLALLLFLADRALRLKRRRFAGR